MQTAADVAPIRLGRPAVLQEVSAILVGLPTCVKPSSVFRGTDSCATVG